VKLTLFILAFMIQSGARRPPFVPPNVPDLAGLRLVTGEQVEEFLAAPKRKRDATLAGQLDSVELTERFTAARLSRCEKEAPGPKTEQALIALADRSAFNPPAAEEILSLAEPALADQKKMIGLTADYAVNTLHRLPNFYATRVTTTYRLLGGGQGGGQSATHIQQVGRNSNTVYYRDGEEEVTAEKHHFNDQGLTTRGEFGPILALAALDAAKGNLAWSRWELGSAGPRAVYSYEVNATDWHYEVSGKKTAYNGEIAVDPASGAILRLVLKAYPDSGKQLGAADVEVDYEPVDLGGRTYLCPHKSVALSEKSGQVWLNDVVFENYHLFQGEVKILPGFTETK
jgi:hypothetical protein